MELVYIGDIVNTHGIKGELRIISEFKYKDVVFQKGNFLYIGAEQEKLEIASYRFHKIYDMVTFKGIDDINDAIIYKGDKVFINRLDFVFPGVINEDILGLEVYNNNEYVGIVENILNSNAHDIIVIKNEDVKNLIPFVDEFVKNIDLDNNRMDIEAIEGMLNEN